MIGAASIPLDHVLQQGEHDQWVPLLKHERYAGEVYMELTFYSLEIPKYGSLGQGRPAAHLPSGTAVRTTSTSQARPLPHPVAPPEVPQALQAGSMYTQHTYMPPYATQTTHPRSPEPFSPLQRAWTVDSPEGVGTTPSTPASIGHASGMLLGHSAYRVPSETRAQEGTRQPGAPNLQQRIASPPPPGVQRVASPAPGRHARSHSMQTFLPAALLPSSPPLPRSPSAQGFSPIRSPPTPRSESVPSGTSRSISAQWLPPLSADDSASSAPDILSQWIQDTSLEEDTDVSRSASAHYLRPARAVTTDAEAVEAAAAALASPNVSHISAHEAIYGTSTSWDTSRPRPSPAWGRRPLPQPRAGGISRSMSVDTPPQAPQPPPPPPRASTPSAVRGAPRRLPPLGASPSVSQATSPSFPSPLVPHAPNMPYTSTPVPTDPPPSYTPTPPPALPPRRPPVPPK